MSSSFTRPLRTEKITEGINRGKFLLLERFEYHIGSKNSEEIIIVPAGFISDGATIPPILWPIIGHPMANYAQGAFLHDILYRDKVYSRKRCDEIFLESMVVLEIALWKRKIIYWGLRVGGWYSWNKGKSKRG